MDLTQIPLADLLKEVERRGAQNVKTALVENLAEAMRQQRDGIVCYTSQGKEVHRRLTPPELAKVQDIIERCQEYFMASTATPQEVAAKAFEAQLKYEGRSIGPLPDMEGKDAATG